MTNNNKIVITKDEYDGDVSWCFERGSCVIADIERVMHPAHSSTEFDRIPSGRHGKVAYYLACLTNGKVRAFDVHTDGDARKMLAAAKAWVVANA